MKKIKNRFEETKIKMVMKLRGLTREDAIKALEFNGKQSETDVGETGHSIARGEHHLITAKEFFGDMDGDNGGFVSAKEFFG